MTNYERIKQMSIEEMADNEVVKALGWLERLKRDTDVSEWAESIEIILNEYNRQKAENDSLKVDLAKCSIRLDNLYKTADEIKSEAIKEFAEKLKNCFAISGDYLDIINIIDSLAKEMTEVNENDRA